VSVALSKLGEQATIIMGQSPPGESYNQDGNGAPLLNGPTEFGPAHPLEKQWTTSPTKFCQSGDVLFCVRGATAGRLNLADKEYCIGRGLAAIRCKTGKFDSGFLRYVLANGYSTFQSRGVGSTFINISGDELANFPVPALPLAEQRRIAEVLDRAEALRAKRRAALAQLDSLTQSLFLDLFGKPKENPKGWPLVPLMEICSPKQWPTISTPELTETGFPVFGANGLIGHYTEYNHEEPTVLITCRGATCGTINVSPPKCYVTGNAMALDNPDSKRITIEYLEAVLRMRSMADTISGTAQPQITRQNLQHVTLPIPPLPLQREFARRVTAVEALKTAQRASLAELDALFATLQHRAFRGELFGVPPSGGRAHDRKDA
jgi:type I restriction enzyme S subunit